MSLAWTFDNGVILGVPNHFIDPATKGNFARFVNHSCDPNTILVVAALYGQWRVFLQALDNITAGETLTVDYGDLYAFEKVKCLCMSSYCTRFIGGFPESSRKKSPAKKVIPVKVVLSHLNVGCSNQVCISYRKALKQRIEEQDEEIQDLKTDSKRETFPRI